MEVPPQRSFVLNPRTQPWVLREEEMACVLLDPPGAQTQRGRPRFQVGGIRKTDPGRMGEIMFPAIQCLLPTRRGRLPEQSEGFKGKPAAHTRVHNPAPSELRRTCPKGLWALGPRFLIHSSPEAAGERLRVGGMTSERDWRAGTEALRGPSGGPGTRSEAAGKLGQTLTTGCCRAV